MIITIGDWCFDVDVSINMEISAIQADDHCTCGYCRNYYKTVDDVYPSLRPFLARFGIDIEGPDELSPFEPTIYEASYIINGQILSCSNQNIFVDGIPVSVVRSCDADMDTERTEPYFVLVIGLMELPWRLDEAQDQVISPANDASYIERMQNKLLKRMQSDCLNS